MLGEQSTSVSDRIQSEWETRKVYLAGRRLSPSESLAVARHSAHGFGWGDGGSGAAQLALALLMRATDRARAVAHYQAFKWEVIARLPHADFTRLARAVAHYHRKCVQVGSHGDRASAARGGSHWRSPRSTP